MEFPELCTKILKLLILLCRATYEVFCNSNIFRRKRPHNTVNSDQPSLFSERHFKGITNTLGIVTRIFKSLLVVLTKIMCIFGLSSEQRE